MVLKLLRLFAIVLELPDEDQLVRDHAYDDRGEDHLRYMHYAARTPEENRKVGELYVVSLLLSSQVEATGKMRVLVLTLRLTSDPRYSPGHTDLGTVTLLFRQPVAALQILNSHGEWKWVQPRDATITINTCDALTALTGGYVKSSVHRVHAPPDDQAHVDRLGVLYFARYVRLLVLGRKVSLISYIDRTTMSFLIRSATVPC